MAVEAVVSVVIQKLTYLLTQESNVFNKATHDVEEVRIMLRDMQSLLKDAEYQEESDDVESRKWATKFLATVYRVEFVIETFALHTIRLRRMGFIKKNAYSMKKEFTSLLILPKDMDANIRNMDALKRNIRKKIEECCNSSKPRLSSITSLARGTNYQDEARPLKHHLQKTYSEYLGEESTIVGLEKNVERLVAQLTSNLNHQTISIHGESGSGKTTLAKTIYKRGDIKEHFKSRAWVFVPRDYKVRDLFLVIMRQVIGLKEDEKKLSIEALKEKLSECLKSTRYLIVMDDVWNTDVFKELRVVLPGTRNGSRVVLTTCKEDVASSANPWKRHKLNPLKDDDSWKLFLKKVSVPNRDPVPFLNHDMMLHLKKSILETCQSLPLMIIMLGGLLSTKRASYDEWKGVLEQYKSFQLTRPTFQCSDILIFAYNDLPLHLKPCFLYLALFPKEFEIPVRRLFRLWLAEGFVKRSPGMIPEDLVEGYLEELLNRMVEKSKRRSDGSLKRCRMLGVLHEIFLPKAVAIGLFHIHDRESNYDQGREPQFDVRRVIEYVDIKGYPDMETYNKNIRSYLSFNIQKKDTPAVEVGKFLHKITDTRGFAFLRVLDLERVYKPSLPEGLGLLFHLRYLGLRWTFLDTLPSSVGNLPYLETLDIKHTYISTLPRSIWKMKHLRHLCLNETRLDMSVQRTTSSSSSLTQLQTLWGLFVDDTSQVKNGLKRLIELRKLGLTSHATSFKELGMWIAELASLQSLRLRSKDKMGRPSDLTLPPLSSLENLSHLYLLGNLQSLPTRNQYPPVLRVLTLSVSQLKDDPMPTLALLPSLTVLSLLAGSYTGQQMDCPTQGFPTLRVLKLWKLEQLEKWTVQKGAMLKLRALEIRCCGKLNELPENLLQLDTFEKLILTNMPPMFVKGTQGKKQKQTAIKVNNWVF